MIYAFDHPHTESHAALRRRLGGKGFSLWLMTHELELPVPPGFTIETRQCEAYLAGHSGPELKAAIRQEMDRLASVIGRAFGNRSAPLLVSVRSGAAQSMPGMMDTVLNVGMTPEVCEALADLGADPLFALQSYKRFLVSYAGIVLGLETGTACASPATGLPPRRH